MYERDSFLRNVGILIEGCKILQIPILWLEQYPEGLGPTVKEVSSHLEVYRPLPKRTFSLLKDMNVIKHFIDLHRDQVLICGIETHVCIYQTSLDILSRGIEIHVVKDAVSSRTCDNKAIGLEKIARAGGHITSVETALFELLEIAEGKAFKEILQLVK